MVIKLTKKVIRKIKEVGLKATIYDLYTLIYDKYYDKNYHLDTYKWVSNQDLDVNDDVKQHASMYMATKTIHLKKAFKILKIPKGKVLVDIGSGKGRVLMVASEFGFREVRGVEFSPKLCAIAEKNIEIFKNKKPTNTVFSITNIDASLYQFKDDEDVFYFYNPFNELILSKVVQNILASLKRRPRDILIIYANSGVKRKVIEEEFDIKQVRKLDIIGSDYLVYNI